MTPRAAGASGASGPAGERTAGSVAEEAALLLEALRGLAATHEPPAPSPASPDPDRPDTDTDTDTDTGTHPGPGEGSGPGDPPRPAGAGERAGSALPGQAAACGYCPFCRLVAALGITRPEVVAHLADAGTSLLAAVRAGLAPADPAAAGRPPSPPVQHIDIT